MGRQASYTVRWVDGVTENPKDEYPPNEVFCLILVFPKQLQAREDRGVAEEHSKTGGGANPLTRKGIQCEYERKEFPCTKRCCLL